MTHICICKDPPTQKKKKARQCTISRTNNEAHPCNQLQCYSRKAISVTYSVCVFEALVIPHAPCTVHAPYYVAICGLSVSTAFFHIISLKGKELLIIKMCVLIFSTNYSHYFYNVTKQNISYKRIRHI
jgi:hypothetical protein